jgi:hypothetical protein
LLKLVIGHVDRWNQSCEQDARRRVRVERQYLLVTLLGLLKTTGLRVIQALQDPLLRGGCGHDHGSGSLYARRHC